MLEWTTNFGSLLVDCCNPNDCSHTDACSYMRIHYSSPFMCLADWLQNSSEYKVSMTPRTIYRVIDRNGGGQKGKLVDGLTLSATTERSALMRSLFKRRWFVFNRASAWEKKCG